MRTHAIPLVLALMLGFVLCSAQPGPVGRMAYISGGDLWVSELPDGTPRRLTTSHNCREPRWSSSGEWLSYHSGNQVRLIRRDGTSSKPLGTPGSPGKTAWSPSSDVIAVGTGKGIAIVAADSGSVVTVVAPGVDSVVWSPDGKHLAYNTATRGVRRDGKLNILAAGNSSSPPRMLFSEHMVNLIPARWTPNGRELLFWKDPDFSASLIADGLDLFRISMEGGKPRETMANTLVHSDVLQFSPDGNELALVEGSGRETWREKRLAILEMATGRLRHLTAADRIALSPAWSPDGKWIAFVSAPAAKEGSGVVDARRVSMDQRRIWLMRPDGSEAHALTTDPKYHDEYPLWSRDGAHVLFARVDSTGKASICVIGVDGRAVRIAAGIEAPSDYYGYTAWAEAIDLWR